jgi:hypothetical protein
MIYTFKVHASAADGGLLETAFCTHGADVLRQAKALIEKHPDCEGVEVLMLGSQLFFMPQAAQTGMAAPVARPEPPSAALMG